MSERIVIGTLRLALALALALSAAAAPAQSTTNAVKQDCALCHGAHGGFGFLLKASDVETLCQSCHGPGGIATQAAVHTKARPTYIPFRISCTGCHNPHTDLWNQIGTRNIDLLATIRDDVNGAKIKTNPEDGGPCAEPAAGGGCIRPQVFADRSLTGAQSHWASTAAPYRGACNVCHTRTKHHRNSDSGGDHTHNINKVCGDCHVHTNGFIK